MPQFDVDAARRSGYSDDEILDHLMASRRFDVDAAAKAGYAKPEIIAHLSGKAPISQWPQYTFGKNIPGMLVPGNIDIQRRMGRPGDPITHNANGSTSTVYSGSFEDKFGRQVLAPFVIPDGAGQWKIATRDEAQKQYEKTGEHLGIFDHYANADQYAQRLHEYLANQGTIGGRIRGESIPQGSPAMVPIADQSMNSRMSDVTKMLPPSTVE